MLSVGPQKRRQGRESWLGVLLSPHQMVMLGVDVHISGAVDITFSADIHDLFRYGYAHFHSFFAVCHHVLHLVLHSHIAVLTCP